jgi:hypothetical protein
MSNCITVFETLKDFLPLRDIENIIKNSNADVSSKEDIVINHLFTMMYSHLTEKKGLRDIEAGIKAEPKLQEYTGTIGYSQISRNNRELDSDVFRRIFCATFNALKNRLNSRTFSSTWGELKILDSTLIRLCISLFPWAHYREKSAAIKMHTLLDLTTGCPENIVLSEGLIHDKDKMESLITNPGVTYLFDRGYVDYSVYDKLCDKDIFFISRLKKNAVIEVVSENSIPPRHSVLSDKEVILGGFYTRMKNTLRIIEVIDSSNGEVFFIVTNRFDLSAEEIAEIYRLRWQIELFFKWIKQNLKIKKFYGTSHNAVLNQLYAALIAFCVLKLMHESLAKGYNFLEFVRLTVNGLWNSIENLIRILSSKKPHTKRNTRDCFDWKVEYKQLLMKYKIDDISFFS